LRRRQTFVFRRRPPRGRARADARGRRRVARDRPARQAGQASGPAAQGPRVGRVPGGRVPGLHDAATAGGRARRLVCRDQTQTGMGTRRRRG